MDYQSLLYQNENGIGIVTINRPSALNALNENVLMELYRKFQEIEEDPAVKVVILTGAGRAFVAGADIGYMHPQSSVEIRKFIAIARRAAEQIYNLNKPVIAAINGYALGGGCEIAMCCDIRIASENAKFGQPEINLGIIPGIGGTQNLVRLVGVAKAKELVFSGDTLDAKTALSLGLVNNVVPADQLMNEAKAFAQKLSGKSSIALAFAKKAMNGGLEVGPYSGANLENECFAACFATEDQKEGMSAFLEKRKANYKGK
jgi:enoyl-CoA hydratase